MGFQMFSSEAQKSPSLKPTSKPSPSNEPINTPLCPKSGNLKRVARAQERNHKILICKHKIIVGLLGSLWRVVCSCLLFYSPSCCYAFSVVSHFQMNEQFTYFSKTIVIKFGNKIYFYYLGGKNHPFGCIVDLLRIIFIQF